MSSANFAIPDFRSVIPVGSLRQSRRVDYNYVMPEPLTRDRIIEALQAMPPNATIDDAIERLLFLGKVETGLAELDRSEGIPHDQPKHRFGL